MTSGIAREARDDAQQPLDRALHLFGQQPARTVIATISRQFSARIAMAPSGMPAASTVNIARRAQDQAAPDGVQLPRSSAVICGRRLLDGADVPGAVEAHLGAVVERFDGAGKDAAGVELRAHGVGRREVSAAKSRHSASCPSCRIMLSRPSGSVIASPRRSTRSHRQDRVGRVEREIRRGLQVQLGGHGRGLDGQAFRPARRGPARRPDRADMVGSQGRLSSVSTGSVQSHPVSGSASSSASNPVRKCVGKPVTSTGP
jgi:hypothetical protein